MARKTSYTPEIGDRIAKLVNAGAPIPRACEASHVSWNTAKTWIKRGRDGIEPYTSFVTLIEEAKAAWVCGATMRITKASEKDWKAAAWLLERREARHFGTKAKVDATIQHSGSMAIQFYIPSNGREDG